MRKINVNELDEKTFRLYGDYISLPDVDGTIYGEKNNFFQPDFFQLDNAGRSASVSLCRVSGKDRLVKKYEYHSDTCEGLLPIDGDIILVLAKPHWLDQTDSFVAYRIPQGCFVKLKAGTLHTSPFSVSGDPVNVLVTLPERTYANDSDFIDLKEDKWLEIQ